MSRLRAQSIERLCQPTKWFGLRKQQPMIVPFSSEKQVINGKSAGLSAASYDCRINHDLVLGPNPGYLVRDAFRAMIAAQGVFPEQLPEYKGMLEKLNATYERMNNSPSPYALAHTVEDFYMPTNLSADVADKSTYARLFVSCFNTFTDPGFQGNLTLEIVNLSAEVVEIKAGDPICQVIFTWLDGHTNRPYRGKYQGQAKGSHAARLENHDGSYIKKEV